MENKHRARKKEEDKRKKEKSPLIYEDDIIYANLLLK